MYQVQTRLVDPSPVIDPVGVEARVVAAASVARMVSIVSVADIDTDRDLNPRAGANPTRTGADPSVRKPVTDPITGTSDSEPVDPEAIDQVKTDPIAVSPPPIDKALWTWKKASEVKAAKQVD